jgi:hypothetical protein
MACAGFLTSLPYILPARSAGQQFQKSQMSYPLDMNEICSDGHELRYFMCAVHNDVNNLLGKPIFSCDPMSLQSRYGTANVCTNFA